MDAQLTPKYIYQSLERGPSCRRRIHVEKTVDHYAYPKTLTEDIQLVLRNSAPFPKVEDLSELTAYIQGGTRYGSRYPDIIINRYDIERAKDILKHNKNTTIVDIVFKRLHIDNLMFNDFSEIPSVFDYPWKHTKLYNPPFFKHHYRFIQNTFTCKSEKKCKKTMKANPNTLTNISALPYTLGDCRELAWYTILLCSVKPTKDAIYRVLYTTIYTVDHINKVMYEFMDHSFVVKFHGNTMTVVDALMNKKLVNCIVLHDYPLLVVQPSKIKDYTMKYFANAHSSRPIFECGVTYVDGVQSNSVYIIPKIYDGSMKFIDEHKFNPHPEDTILFWNKQFPYTDKQIWNTHRQWDIAV